MKSRPIFHHAWMIVAFAGLAICACSRSQTGPYSESSPYKMNGPLVSAKTTMVTAWFVPKNPLTDPSLDDSKLSKEIKRGFRIFTDTPKEAPRLAPGKMSCNNCHLNGGQRERSLPLVGVAGMFPEYNRRSGRLYSLADRIVDCFLRSENATGALEDERATDDRRSERSARGLGLHHLAGARLRSRQEPVLARSEHDCREPRPIPVEKLDKQRGEATVQGALHVTVTAKTARASRSATRKPARCGDRTRGMTAPAPRASTRSPASSATRCLTWIRAA